MLLIARAGNWDRGEFNALLNEALEREPLFYQTYFGALEYLLPKWHGNIQEIEDFAQDAAERTRKREGSAFPQNLLVCVTVPVQERHFQQFTR